MRQNERSFGSKENAIRKIQYARDQAIAALAWLYPVQYEAIRSRIPPSNTRTSQARKALARKHPVEFKRIYQGAREIYAPSPRELNEQHWQKVKAFLLEGREQKEAMERFNVTLAFIRAHLEKDAKSLGK